MAAILSVGKAQEDEEEDEQKELKFMMMAFAVLVVLITLLGQLAWKVGVGMWSRRSSSETPEAQVRSLPAQEDRERAQKGARSSTGVAGGEMGSGSSSEPLVRLPSGGREDSLSSRPGELGLGGGDPVRLPGPEVESSSSSDWTSGGPSPVEGDLERRIEEEMRKIGEEEAELWRIERQAPLPPVLIEEVEEDPEEGLRFPILRTKFGVVYHSTLTCKHLQGARVSLPREFKWCRVCRRVALRTRGRPPPGSSILLSVNGAAAHTDERCPWVQDAKWTPFCLTCRDRERG
eukprot:s438_g9.t1